MAMIGAQCAACCMLDNKSKCLSCNGSGLFTKPRCQGCGELGHHIRDPKCKLMQAERRKKAAANAAARKERGDADSDDRSTAASEFDAGRVVCHYCHQPGHILRNCPERMAAKAAADASRVLEPLEELEARKTERKLKEISRISAKVHAGAKVDNLQLQKIHQKCDLEQLPVMQKISEGWKRDERPQSELIEAMTLTEHEEEQARLFEKKILKLRETQAKVRAAIQIDNVQLEILEKKIEKLNETKVFKKISAGFRRRNLDA